MMESIRKQRLTSPGLLLIAAIAAAGGIFLVDQFVLGPHVAVQEASALRQQAVRAEQAAREVLAGHEKSLTRACRSLAGSARLRQLVGEVRSGPGLEAPAAELPNLEESGAQLAWISAPDGEVLRVWPLNGEWKETARHVPAAMARLGRHQEGQDLGLLTIHSDVAIVTRQAVTPAAHQDGPPHFLWLARRIDATVVDSIASAVGGSVVLVAAGEMPEGMAGDLTDSQAMWSVDENTLAVGWRLRDIAGRSFGYFLADIPVPQIRRQAVAARRTVQIILSLSVGLCVLVILGTHILVSGPVIRLLRRIQRLDTGDGRVDELTRNLHGEPLVLARRLESAFEQLASLSKTEQLTGMANRRHFEHVLDAFYYQARRYNRPLSLILLDIDFFKAVNDAGGHKAGDELLKEVAGAIESVCRKADLPARLGGDEFAILLPETPASNAADVAERIRAEVSKLVVPIHGTQANVTVSIGIADLNSGEIDSPDAMMSLADRAMYQAKQNGRNCVFQADALSVPQAIQPQHAGQMDLLRKKVIGLDAQFKEIFVQGLEEIMEILAHRDSHMAAHAQKVRGYASLIAQEMGLPERVIKRLGVAAMLHDIGMLAMPDSVLLCEGALGEAQMKCVRQHPLLSVRIMESMEFLEQEIPTVRYHHEKFDGTGYPEGIGGSVIPLTARILAVADAFDAMTSPRTFRAAKTVEETLGELQQKAGSQFDPAVVEAMVAVARRFGEQLFQIVHPAVRERISLEAGEDEGEAVASPVADRHDER